MKGDTILVDQWKPSQKDIILKVTGQMIHIDFNKIIKAEIPEDFKCFIIKKISYSNWMGDHIKRGNEVQPIIGGCHYINYFIKFYDTEGELLLSYLKLKYMIDESGKKMKAKAMKKAIYEIMFTDTLIQNIKRMTEDNWILDLTPDPKKKYPEQLKFDNNHAKILMNISMGIKILIPVVMHYLNVTGLFDEDSNNITPFYLDLFDIFSGNVDIYNKLWIMVTSKVNRSSSDDEVIWNKHEMFDREEHSYIHELLHTNIIRDAIFRYVFDSSLLSFNSAIIEYQLSFMMQTKFPVTFIDVDNSGSNNAEGLSGLDKIELNSFKVDEGTIILNKMNIENNIKKLRKAMKFKDFEDAVEYYKEHHKILPLHVQIGNIFASRVGCRDLSILNRTQYIQMMVIIKRMLQMKGFVYIPQILSANIKVNKRIIRNKKFISSIETSDFYRNIMNNKYEALVELGKESIITNMMSTVVSSTYQIVDYDNQDKLGTELEIDSNELLSEFLNYLNLA